MSELRLQCIDDLNRSDHFYLDENDKCYYWGEYTKEEEGSYKSPVKSLICNLKKSPLQRTERHYYYKTRDIDSIASKFKMMLNDSYLRQATFIPIPPSKTREHLEYDDRLLKILNKMTQGLSADVRELVSQIVSTPATHDLSRKPNPEELLLNYAIDEAKQHPTPLTIGVFDDLLTTGSHFKAMKSLLQGVYPGVSITGIFIARRVPEAPVSGMPDPSLDDWYVRKFP
jgi:predicted amidophosphoribosyltransferase